MVYDLCVVGAGMFGSAAARHASADAGLNVILIGPEEKCEKSVQAKSSEKQLVFSCHDDEGRITRVADKNVAFQHLSKKSIERYREIEKLSGVTFYHPCGFMGISKETNKYLQSLSAGTAVGKVPMTKLTNEEVKIRFPFLNLKADEVTFLDQNGSGYIRARRIVKAQINVAIAQGCTVMDDTVMEVHPQTKNAMGTYHQVVTASGTSILAKRVLVCAGAFTKFLPVLPDRLMDNVISTVSQETAVLLKIPKENAEKLGTMPSMVYHGTGSSPEENVFKVYVLPPMQYPDGNYYIKIGHSEDSGDELKTLGEVQAWYRSDGNQDIITKYPKILTQFIPDLDVQDVVPITCVCCYTPSGLPYIDRLTSTISLAYAGNGVGAKMSDEIGRLAAELSVHGRWDSELPKSLFEITYNRQRS